MKLKGISGPHNYAAIFFNIETLNQKTINININCDCFREMFYLFKISMQCHGSPQNCQVNCYFFLRKLSDAVLV